jgi:prepilin-type N-terminal cleavage/methylation domain-containing protein
MKKKFNRGFTLIELMVVIALVAILATIAAPNLTTFLVNSQRRAVIGDLQSSIAFARSEAIKRGIPVVLRSNGTGSYSMQNGWTTFADPNGTGTPPTAPSPDIVEVKQAYPAADVRFGCGLMLPTDTFEYVRFDGQGRKVQLNGTSPTGPAGASNLNVQVLRDGAAVSLARITFDWGGRSSVTLDSNSAGC